MSKIKGKKSPWRSLGDCRNPANTGTFTESGTISVPRNHYVFSPDCPNFVAQQIAPFATARRRVAALYVETGGCYYGLPEVDPWDRERDARDYAGPWPVVAHPPCERWGRYWGGAPGQWPRLTLGDDGGCFAAALAAVRAFGGVLEHPEGSHAWRAFNLNTPPRCGGWIVADFFGGWTCCVEQGHYGHLSRKATWLYAIGVEPPSLHWGRSEQRIHPVALARHGYAKARRIGMMAMVGGKNKTRIRNATPLPFRDLLLSIARTAVRP